VLEFSSDDPIAARAMEALYHAAPATTAPPTLRYRLRRLRAGRYEAFGPGRPLFGPAALADAWAFLEWRATDDLLSRPPTGGGGVFLHAAAAELGSRLLLIVGDSGAGKSTLVAHLLARGHRLLGDDLVRFTPVTRSFEAVGRSVKLDDNSLRHLPLIACRCALAVVGTFLAAGCYYVSPAAIRRDWEAAPARPWAVVLLDRSTRNDRPGIVKSSEGEAAVFVAEKVLGGDGSRGTAVAGGEITVRLLESLADVTAFRALGGDPAFVAASLEREALR
jgi:hypothetical protein